MRIPAIVIAAWLVAACTPDVRVTPTGGAPPFRDLNRNGWRDAYEDPRITPEGRARDLVSRMTLEEKAGAMMHDTLPGRGGAVGESAQGYDLAKAEALIVGKHVNSFLTRLDVPPQILAAENNRIQKLAEGTRLGIPVTISTDPRNHFQQVFGASSAGAGFSKWPEPLGFAALHDESLVRRFADIARREYRAVGIHMTLSPQADLFTEPRWPRAAGTFGSNSALTSRLVRAYVEGFQNGARGLGRDGVAVVVKHWVGYGAQPEGFDGHNYYGRFARLSDASFPNHVAAFDGAFAARVSGVMPAFPIVQGVTLNGRAIEPVAPGFSAQLLDDLLRGEKRFKGLVLSDWAITKNCDEGCRAPTATQPQEPSSIATPWGVESLSRPERFAKAVAAGIDQFGGTSESELLLEVIRANGISERRLDESVQRIMVLKFQMGLFDHPYVDLAVTAATMENAASQREADTAQRRAMVLLENRNELIPLPRQRSKVWLHGLDPEEARRAGLTVVESPPEADVAIVRTTTPSELLHPHHFFGQRQREGRLDFREGDPEYRAIVQASAKVPTLVVIELDRAAILTTVREKAGAILATFGASDAAVLDVILGRATAEGVLPFELPSSMKAVEAQDPALPDDSSQPLYPAAAGAKR